MKPYMLKGHSRPLTHVMYNREGDLVFSTSKDSTINLWYSENGKRVGTYEGHEGAVWYCDVSFDSKWLVTASSDTKAKLWDVETGKELFEWKHDAMVRCVSFSIGDKMILSSQDSSFNSTPSIFVHKIPEDLSGFEEKPVAILSNPDIEKNRMNRAVWVNMNKQIISSDDAGFIRVWDVETGKHLRKIEGHKKAIQDMQLSKDGMMVITASVDFTSKVFDVKELCEAKVPKPRKEYISDRPLNSASISPLKNHVIIGGGQEARDVTTTSGKSGHFEVDFFHLVYEEKLDSVKGHFGPVHTLSFSPDGKGFTSGSEDGYIRLHHFDDDYFTAPDY